MAGINKACQHCGRKIKKARIGQKFCSISCGRVFNNYRVASGKEHWAWNGGKHINTNGYIEYSAGILKGQLEHRVIAETIMGRKLNRLEAVHHKDGNKKNNNPLNLMVTGLGSHSRGHMLGSKPSPETIEKFKKIRAGTNQKEKHNQWRSDITENLINNVLLMYKYKKDAAKHLGISPDTLRDRIKYYKKGGYING